MSSGRRAVARRPAELMAAAGAYAHPFALQASGYHETEQVAA
ncbi:hypothetical protein QEZ54_32400 [Catellatospora sp. KI3]|nr:hypothetical protein [Catellatospora sp. KI3]MDI1465683.1 hypothetical protein [Catellatospora sp. KI3]